MRRFQDDVRYWCLSIFGRQIADDKVERNHRFCEEALELVQALGMTREDAHDLVNYVYDRPAGEPRQEVGGVAVTFAALCAANGLDMQGCALRELERISQPDVMAKIRAKQAAKPKFGPRPEAKKHNVFCTGNCDGGCCDCGYVG